MKIGFIGVGVMGRHMVNNLLNHGYDVSIYARNKEKVEDFINQNVKCYDTIKELTENSNVVITIVGFPNDVEEVYFDCDKIINNAKPGTILIDMTTSSPSLAEKIYKESKTKNLYAMDCPVTGGDIGAKTGNLTIFAAGDEEIFETVKPILEAMGKHICYCGEAGKGQHAKLANQIGIAGSLAAVCELYAYAKVNGLDVEKILPYWQSGSAGSFQMNTAFQKAIQGNYEPGFYTKHFIKDMKLALNEAKNKNVDLEMLDTVLNMYLKLQNEGFEDKGTQIITKYYEKE